MYEQRSQGLISRGTGNQKDLPGYQYMFCFAQLLLISRMQVVAVMTHRWGFKTGQEWRVTAGCYATL